MSLHLLNVKWELTCPGAPIPSASSYECPPCLGHTYHLPGLLKLGVEALQLLGHLPRCLEGPTGPGEDTSAVGTTGRTIVPWTELTRACSWGAGCLPGASTELWREGVSKRLPKAPPQPLPSHTRETNSQTSPWQQGTRNLFPWQPLSTPVRGQGSGGVGQPGRFALP